MIFEDLKLAEFNDFYKVILGNFPSKEIKEYDYMKETFINGDFKVLTLKEDDEIKGILSHYDGGEFAFVDYFAVEDHREEFFRLLEEVKIPEEETTQEEQIFAGMNFVITGSVEHFANRNEVKEEQRRKSDRVCHIKDELVDQQ